MRTDFNIARAFEQKHQRGWEFMYWMIDLHDTVFPGKYASDQDLDMYPGCAEVLQWISNRPDQKIIIWTSSYDQHVNEVRQMLWDDHKIVIDFYNENPDCGNTHYATFETKPYFNVLLDDKAGFQGETDWFAIKKVLQNIYEWEDMPCNT